MFAKATILMHRIVVVPTQWGPKTFTDISIEYQGGVYGARHLGAWTMIEIQNEVIRLMKRNDFYR